MVFEIRYQIAGYSGTRSVEAEDGEQAIAKVKAWARRNCSMPMFAEGYKIVSAREAQLAAGHSSWRWNR